MRPLPLRPARHLAILPSLLLGLASTAAAQDLPTADAPPLDSSLLVGLNEVDGSAWAMGPGFAAEFTENGLRFHPVVGPDAPTATLGFELLGGWRGNRQVLEAQAIEPQLDGLQATYQRSRGFQERYAVDAEGVHQSFLLDARPAGEGDLILRGRLLRERLPQLAVNAEGELRFESAAGDPNPARVSFGRLTAFDADGQQTAGQVTHRDGLLELRVPAAFVDAASYPLLLDPLIGSDGQLSATASPGTPDVAYSRDDNIHLAVWNRPVSSTINQLIGLRLQDGVPFPIPVIYADEGALSTRPSVACIAYRERFLIAYQQSSGGVSCFSIAADSGDRSGIVALGTGKRPDVGGARGETNANVQGFIVWEDTATGRIAGARLESPAATGAAVPNPVPSAPFFVSSGTDASWPAITKSGGDFSRYVVAWEQLGEILVVALDGPSAAVWPTTETQLTLSSLLEKTRPDVDGDSTDFLVGYSAAEGILPDAPRNAWITPVRFLSSTQPLQKATSTILAGEVDTDEFDVAVAWAGSTSFVGHRRTPVGGLAEAHLTEHDLLSGVEVEDLGQLGLGLMVDQGGVALVTAINSSANATEDTGYAVWDALAIRGQAFEAMVGLPTTDLGGGCDGGGSLTYDGPVALGNSDLEAEMSGADPAASLAYFGYVQAGNGFQICGPCETIFGLPQLRLLLTPALLNNGSGGLTIPIPADAALLGAKLDTQWLTIGTSASPCPLIGSVATSNRVGVELAY